MKCLKGLWAKETDQTRLVTAPIVGTNSPRQLEENLGALELKLADDDVNQLNEVSDWAEMDNLAR